MRVHFTDGALPELLRLRGTHRSRLLVLRGSAPLVGGAARAGAGVGVGVGGVGVRGGTRPHRSALCCLASSEASRFRRRLHMCPPPLLHPHLHLRLRPLRIVLRVLCDDATVKMRRRSSSSGSPQSLAQCFGEIVLVPVPCDASSLPPASGAPRRASTTECFAPLL